MDNITFYIMDYLMYNIIHDIRDKVRFKMSNVICYMPQRVDACKFRFLKEKLSEKGVSIPHNWNPTSDERAELQKTISEILRPMSLSQAYNYLLVLERENNVKKNKK